MRNINMILLSIMLWLTGAIMLVCRYEIPPPFLVPYILSCMLLFFLAVLVMFSDSY